MILSLGLVILMFFSVLGYGFVGRDGSGEETKIEYNGFEFVKQNNVWILSTGEVDFFFKYNPKEVEQISVAVNYIDTYAGKPLYIYSENNEASSEIYVNLNEIAQRIQLACLNEEDCVGDVPLKTCEDNFIIIRENNETNIIQEDNCVHIMGPSENLTMMSDVFLFKTIGIEA